MVTLGEVWYAVAMLYSVQKLLAVLQEPAEAIPICSLCLRADKVNEQCGGTDENAMLCCIDCGRCGQSFQHLLSFVCSVMSSVVYVE